MRETARRRRHISVKSPERSGAYTARKAICGAPGHEINAAKKGVGCHEKRDQRTGREGCVMKVNSRSKGVASAGGGKSHRSSRHASPPYP